MFSFNEKKHCSLNRSCSAVVHVENVLLATGGDRGGDGVAVSVHCLGEHHLTENLQAFVQHGDDKNSDARSKKLCNLKKQT